MGTLRLAYSTSGLTGLGFSDAVAAIDAAGYAGVEIAFHRDQFNVFELGDDELVALRRQFERLRARPACIATAAHFFEPQRPHEPSLLAVERAARKRRIDLVRQGVRVARSLGVPLVTFGSGFLRDEHVRQPEFDVDAALVESITECLVAIRDDEDITLLIEPEPGMHIETLAQARTLIEAVGSPKFGLHIDLCHARCTEADYVAALARHAAATRYLHVSDAPVGYNLRVVQDADELAVPRSGQNLLVHFPESCDFLLLDRAHPVLFAAGAATARQRARVEALLAAAGAAHDAELVDYATLPARSSLFDEEIFTWLISNPGLSYDVLERARPVARWLRGVSRPGQVRQRLANTRTGIAHWHDIPGTGTLDFAASFAALAQGGFDGYAAVELYHHVTAWQEALTASRNRLQPLVDQANAASMECVP